MAIYIIKPYIHYYICSKLGLDLVPRNGPTSVDPNKVGIVSLHQVHMNSAENAKASSVSQIISPLSVDPDYTNL